MGLTVSPGAVPPMAGFSPPWRSSGRHPRPTPRSWTWLKKAAQNAVEDGAQAQVERLIRNTIRFAVDDPICSEEASTSCEASSQQPFRNARG